MSSWAAPWGSFALVFLVLAVCITGVGSSTSFNITNSCSYTVWPAITSGAGSAAALDTTGFELAPGESRAMPVPSSPLWSGRVWGRTLCSTDTTGTGGSFSCVTGDCGSGRLDCAGGNAAPPVTLAQFALGGMDTYDVSLVDGFNLPLLVAPQGGSCAAAGCVRDLNGACPPELRVMAAAAGGTGTAVACRSACQAFGSPQYCCTGEYANPDTCKPSPYSELFKKACPRAFSYAYDGAASTFTCGGGAGDITYVITFCPIITSGKPSTSPDSQTQSQPPAVTGNLPHIDGTMPYAGGSQVGAPTAALPLSTIIISLVGAIIGFGGAVFGAVKLKCFRQGGAGE